MMYDVLLLLQRCSEHATSSILVKGFIHRIGPPSLLEMWSLVEYFPSTNFIYILPSLIVH